MEEKCVCVGKLVGIGPITGTGAEVRNSTCHKPVVVENSKMAPLRVLAIGICGSWMLVSSSVPPERLNIARCIVQKAKVWLSFEQPL